MRLSPPAHVLRAFTRYSGSGSGMARSLPPAERIIQPVPRTALITLLVLAVIVVAIVGWAIGINNQLVRLEQGVNETWAQVQNVYQRRADLIPNLVETVKGFTAQERTVLEEVTKARASASSIHLHAEARNDP